MKIFRIIKAIKSNVAPVSSGQPGVELDPNIAAQNANLQQQSIAQVQALVQAQQEILTAADRFEGMVGEIGLKNTINNTTNDAITKTQEYMNLQGTGKIKSPQDMLNNSIVSSLQQITTNLQTGQPV